ncbi:serine hydrolase domain-containing protein [Maribacter sp.]|uniref:serine hydrolase domain-containing protein n=1 Tax=Maribacter sp. TaxID=1897614 RepID=UPI0032974093
MKNLLIPIFGIIVLFTSCKKKETTNSEQSILKNRIESYLNECDKNGVSGSILIAQEGEILYSGGLGLSDRNRNTSITKETIFTIGSITKQFTATAIVKLQEEKQLSVNDSLGRFFSNIPTDKKNITIHQLLTHTSGILGSLPKGGDFVPIKKEAFLEQVFNSPLDFTPGSSYNYSNVGYSLLTIIIEQVSQQDYETFLNETFFKKLDMKNTGYLLPNWNANNLSRAYKCEEDRGTHIEKWKANSNEVSYHQKGNGGILSNPSDMYTWHMAIEEYNVLNEASTKLLIQPYALSSIKKDIYYGYGWVISKSERDTRKIAHSGFNGVNYSNFIRLPDEKNTVIIYMTSLVRYDTRRLGKELEKLIFEDNYQPIIPKMNSTKYVAGEEPNERMAIINKFVSILLKTDTEETIEHFIKTNIPDVGKHKGFKRYFSNMQEEFTDYRLVHTLEYEDYTYDILLKSNQGVIEELTPCFDFKFNNQNKITAFGW